MEKQIEEMAGIIKPIIVTSYVLCDANSKHRASEQIKKDKLKNATALYNAGYRKIPENAVVLTIPFGQELHFLYSREHYRKPQPPCIYSTKEWIFNIRADGKNWFSVAGRGIGYYGEYLHEIGKTVFIDKEKAELYLRGQTNGNDKS